jgi:hypothetical protein
MLPMHLLLLTRKSTRRKVVRTGAKLVYAAPLIAGTMDVSWPTPVAEPSPAIREHGTVSRRRPNPESYWCASLGRCFARLGGGTVCAHENMYDRVAPCDLATPFADGLVCVTSSCCAAPICLKSCAA